jgi:DNA gyrase subunit B
MEVSALIKRWSRRYDESVLRQMVYMPVVDAALMNDRSGLESWVTQLARQLDGRDDIAAQYEAKVLWRQAKVGDGFVIEMARTHHGVTRKRRVQKEFFESGEYASIAALGKDLLGLIGEGAEVRRGEKTQPIGSFREAMDWLMDEAKKGQTIQRYKGLGEMNPDQLWDTTVNPETRRLMQVRIEDAVGADEIFTTLMGDQVEPRRAFIEQNALLVSNLDI